MRSERLALSPALRSQHVQPEGPISTEYPPEVDWGDGSSMPFSVSVAEGGSTSVMGSHTWTETGNYTITITANDDDGGQSVATETATVADGLLTWLAGNNSPTYPPTWSQTFDAAPNFSMLANQTNTEGDSVSLPVQANDSDGDAFSYDALNLPPGLSINSSTGVISGTVAYGAAESSDGSYNPTILIVDGKGGSKQTAFSWTINPAQVTPTLTSPGAQTNLRGGNVSLQRSATQVDNDAITYDASNLPAGLSIDSQTGLISGTVDPSATLGTPYTITVTATDDSNNLSVSQSFNWTINATNVAPVLANPGDQTNAAGDQVSLQLSATDPDGDALTHTATGLPAGLSFDPITGTIIGTLANSAASSTPYTVTVTASDGMASSSQSFSWTVNYVGLSNPGDQSNLDGDNVSLQLGGNDASGLSLTYSATGLPPGLSISSGGLISGTISNTAETGSPYAVTVTASDGTHSVSQSFTWSVAKLALNAPGDQENQEGAAVALQLSATDSGGTPAYSVTGLPPGLSLNSASGLITGTVGLGAFGSSPYQVTVTATDGGSTSSQSFVWTVTPRVALVNPGDQSSASGDSVSLQVTATSSGGTLTYSASGLPDGLSINSSTGLISGTPTTANTTPYTVTLMANDGTYSSSQTFAWTVSVINLVSPGDQANNDGDNVSLSLAAGYHGGGMLSYSATGLPPGTIDWGDGTTDTGAIDGGNGSFTVSGDHTYSEAGSYTITVQVTNSSTGASATAVNTATVTDAALHLTGGFQLGDSMTKPETNFALAWLKDDNPNASASDYSIVIDWGDGSTPTNMTSLPQSFGNGAFLITGSHTYPDPRLIYNVGPVAYTVTVTVTDADGASASTTSTVEVGWASAGVPASMSYWWFQDANPNATAGDYVANGQSGGASIDWGDGTSGVGTIGTGGGGGGYPMQFYVSAQHTFAQDSLDQPNREYPITVTTSDVDGSVLSGSQCASIVRPNVTLAVADQDISSSLVLNNVEVAAFSDTALTDTASEYTAAIDWGDGTPVDTSGVIQQIGPGFFRLMGSHTYAENGWYQITVTISQGWGEQKPNIEGAGEAKGKPVIQFRNVISSQMNTGVDTLKVAKWQTAFNKAQTAVVPNFVNKDEDRFQVWVKDPKAQAATITVHVSTSSDAGQDVVLTPKPGRPNEYISKWLLLTSVQVDKAQAGTAGFFVKLDDTVEAAYKGQEARATVPVKKVVTLHINILNVAKGQPAIGVAGALKDVDWADRIYAAAGILFHASIDTVDPPSKINLSDGLLSHFIYGLGTIGQNKIKLTPEEMALLGAATLRAKNNIDVYYVNYLANKDGKPFPTGGYAESFPASRVPDAKYADSIIVSADKEVYQTLAHEIGHILMNTANHVTGSIVNLMAGDPRINNTEMDSRRITDTQATLMLTQRRNLLSNP